MDLCLRLIDKMDVLIENFRPGAMERLGLGFETLNRRNPRLVYRSISGYGQTGPSRDEAAMDLIVECSSGFMSITGTEAGEQVRSGYAVADINAGMHSAIGILLALRARDVSGRRTIRDVAMQDSVISAMNSTTCLFGFQCGASAFGRFIRNGSAVHRLFERRIEPFRLRRKRKIVGGFLRGNREWSFVEKPEFATNAQRVRNRQRP